jgi:6,7-dimethyl-8-ribityllumazine synthase
LNRGLEEAAIMDKLKKIQGELSARDLRIGIVAARFNDFIVDSLLRGAVDTLLRHGATEKDITLVRVPGAWEMPWAVKKMATSRRFDAIIALGAVIRGATPHFDFVAGECAKGIAQAGLAADVPVAFGVLTTDTIEQALERAGTKAGNKGADAAVSAIEMARLLPRLEA